MVQEIAGTDLGTFIHPIDLLIYIDPPKEFRIIFIGMVDLKREMRIFYASELPMKDLQIFLNYVRFKVTSIHLSPVCSNALDRYISIKRVCCS